jgi:hypothetical protein
MSSVGGGRGGGLRAVCGYGSINSTASRRHWHYFFVCWFLLLFGTCLVVLCSSSAASVCLLGPKIRGTRVHMHLLDHRNQYQIKMASLSASNVVAQLPKLRV